MPARFGALGISVLALVASFGFVYALGRPFATEAEADPSSSPTISVPSSPATPSKPAPPATPSEPASPVVIRISVFTDRLDPNGGHEPIPGGEVWLVPGTVQPTGPRTPGPGDPAESDGKQLCLQLGPGWHPVGQGWPDKQENTASSAVCSPLDPTSKRPVEILLER
jgi:hypothetical protein